jgi:hypothetical protein
VIRKLVAPLSLLLLVNTTQAENAGGPRREVVSCQQATLARPGNGRSYSGAFVNEDYALSVRVPDGLKGWDGSAQDAPFHGFEIALDSTMTTCIVFEVHLRVEDGDAPRHFRGEKAIQLGKAHGWQTVTRGSVDKVSTVNVRTTFSFERPGETDDGEILLVAPSETYEKARVDYDAFINSLKFGH